MNIGLCTAFATLIAASTAFGQLASATAGNPSTAATEPLTAASSQVPSGYAITGKLDRVVILRFKYDTDLLAGMEELVKQQGIQNGVIVAAIGSVRGYKIDQVSGGDLPSKTTIENNPASPAELTGMNGYIIQGRVHAHITLGTPEKAIAGHLQSGTRALTPVIVTIAVMNAADFSRMDDQTYR